MSINQSTMLRIVRRGVAVFLLAASAISSFAILGDKGRSPKSRSFLTSQHSVVVLGCFSLKSNYNFRGSQILNPANTSEYIDLNTTITYQKGKTTYILPLKKKIFVTTNSAGFTLNH